MSSDVPDCNIVVGLKQSTKAIKNDEAKMAYIANGFDIRLRNEFVKLCKKNSVPFDVVKSPYELGKMFNVDVNSSVAVILKDEK